MTGEPIVTFVGNAVADAELRYIQSGVPVVNFTVACTPKSLNKRTDQWEDGEAMFVRCSAWRDHAENIAESISKGMRLVVTGKLTVRNYEWEGQQRTSLELAVDEVGPSLRYARAQVTKMTRSQGQPVSQGTAQPQASPNDYDPWAAGGNPAPQFGDLPPF